MPSKKYPSDVSQKEFKQIESLLTTGFLQTKPRRVSLFKVFNAILYVQKSGCPWRMLPKDFPKWQLVYYYFAKWSKIAPKSQKIPLEEVLKKIGRRRAPK